MQIYFSWSKSKAFRQLSRKIITAYFSRKGRLLKEQNITTNNLTEKEEVEDRVNLSIEELNKKYEAASGMIPHTLLNDYMFHYIFQNNKPSLKKLCCALLGYEEDSIDDVIVQNTIIPGKSIDDKGVVLDLLIQFTSGEHVNIELQVVNQGDWTNRSLAYLCRTFDNLSRGEEYRNMKSVTHIGITDFDLVGYGLSPEFYAKYRLMNIKNHEIYNRNFNLNVLSLKHINLATKQDQEVELDYWAKLFKAKTWEELKMIAAKNDELNKSSRHR